MSGLVSTNSTNRLSDLYFKVRFDDACDACDACDGGDNQLDDFFDIVKRLGIKHNKLNTRFILLSSLGLRSAKDAKSFDESRLIEVSPRDAINACRRVYLKEESNDLITDYSKFDNFKFVIDRDRDVIFQLLKSMGIKIDKSTNLKGSFYHVEDGVLKCYDSLEKFNPTNATEYSIRQIRKMIRRIRADQEAMEACKVVTNMNEQISPTTTVKRADKIRQDDLVYIPHLGEGLYKAERIWDRFVVKDNNVKLCDAFDSLGRDVSGIKIAFKYSPENQVMLSKLFGRDFLDVYGKQEIQRKISGLINNGFRILSASNGENIVSYTKEQADMLVELVSEDHSYLIVHPITGIVIQELKMFSILVIFQIVLVTLKLLELITIGWGFVFIPTYIIGCLVLISIMIMISLVYKGGTAYSKRSKHW